jgi:hypothetical protein
MAGRRIVPEHEVLEHLIGVSGPCTTAELVEHARRGGAPGDVVATLEHLGDRTWTSAEDAVAAIGTGRSPGPRGAPDG